jgi:hypothetical protein
VEEREHRLVFSLFYAPIVQFTQILTQPTDSQWLVCQVLGGDQDFVFTLTNVVGNMFTGFNAQSSMSGSAELIPEPASLALVACGALLIIRKRK